MDAAARPYRISGDGLLLSIRLQPNARRNHIDGVAADADGGAVLKVSVTAAPEGGKANAALIALLAKAWRIPKSRMRIARGTTDRRKTLLIEGDGAALAAAIERALETGP